MTLDELQNKTEGRIAVGGGSAQSFTEALLS
jgi:hypothetical protein